MQEILNLVPNPSKNVKFHITAKSVESLRISHFPPSDFLGLEHFSQLHSVQLFDCQIESSFSLPQNLTKLELIKCNLHSVPNTIRNISCLEELNISENSVTQIPSWIESLSHLECLDISKNPINEFKFTRPLLDLNLAHTQIESITDFHSILFYLNLFEISHCPIHDFSWLPDLHNIFGLYLEGLNLNQIPSEIFNGLHKQLTAFSLSDNPLEKFPEKIAAIPNLHELYLENTKLDSLPINLRFPDVQNLDLGGNRFSSDIMMQKVFPNTQCLWMDNSNIENFPISWLPKQLSELSLAKNKISSVELSSSFPQLYSLDLSQNRLSSVPTFSRWFPNLTNLNLFGNPFSPEIIKKLDQANCWDPPGLPYFSDMRDLSQL